MKRFTRGIVGFVIAAAIWAATPAHAVNFSGPTHFGTFAGPNSVDIGNFNGEVDSDPDLILGSTGSTNLSRLLGGSGGSFGSLAAVGGGGGPRDAAVGNFDFDSDPDLAVVRTDFDTLSIMQGAAGGSFTGPANNYVTGDAPGSPVVGSFNTDVDTLPDVVVANGGSGTISVFLGAGGGAFTGPTNFAVGTAPVSIAIGSFNPETDSDPDLAVANTHSSTISILLGGPGGSFGAATTVASNFPRSVAAGDFNGDGDSDLAVGQNNAVCSCDVLAIQLGGAGAGFSPSTEYPLGTGPYHDMVVRDLDANGSLDIAVPKLNSSILDNVSVLVGIGDGNFTGPVNFGAASGAKAIASGDFDADSKPDLAVANNIGNTVSILLNTTPPPPPAPPTLTDTDPNSPANENSPEVKGTATAGTTVRLYATPDCTGIVAATGSAASFASPGLTVSVADDSTTTFYATATDASGNASGCSTSSITYTEDSTAPDPPDITATDPGSPANDNSPEVRGTYQGFNISVRLYATSGCTGSPAASGSSSNFASPGLTVSVADDSTTTFRATAIDPAGNVSSCSISSITYVEDSTAPDTTIDSGPSGPTEDPTFTFSSSEAGSTFECKVDSGSFQTCSSPKIYRLSVGSHTFTVRATDEAGNIDASPAARSFTVVGYARPKSASPITLKLVPAFEPCVSDNGTHGAPLSVPSCSPPAPASDYLTVGTPDTNGLTANSLSSLVLKVVGESPIDPNNGDQADVTITMSLTDVLRRGDLSEYTGQLEGVLTLRITDRLNGADNAPGTVTDIPFRFPIGCASTAGPAGGACGVTTTADAVTGGVVEEGVRTIWELGDVQVFDGGSDELASTTGDNTLFAVQGLFTP